MSAEEFYDREIPAFANAREYQRFLANVQELLAAGVIQEIPADPNYGPGLLFGGRWFRYPVTGAIWRLLEPAGSFRGAWEQVRLGQQTLTGTGY